MQQTMALGWILFFSITLTACGGGGAGSSAPTATQQDNPPADDAVAAANLDPLDETLIALINEQGLTGDASFNRTLADINDPIAHLGMKLFFSKSLSGDFDVACVSCHHPALGGADALSLPVGVNAQSPDLLGPGRLHDGDLIPNVPRNSPTVFNLGIWDEGLFFDSRVESFGKEEFANGAVSDIRTPDVAAGNVDPNAGANLPQAQARFPVTSAEEMRGPSFESGNSNEDVRLHLAARIGNYGIGLNELSTNTWLTEFENAFGSTLPVEELITFDNIALALAQYQRSMNFTNNPFKDYVEGDLDALTDQQKQGAILFFTPAEEDGGNCSQCHSGDTFTDEQHHTVAFPQFGHGKGDGNADDFGRERETANTDDRYRFRTPSLLNIALTAPYGHAGAYEDLQEVLRHYNNPRDTVEDFFADGGACSLEQFEDLANCDALYPAAQNNSDLALDKLADERNRNIGDFPNLNLNNNERQQIVAFLQALTDPCAADRSCIAPWIAPLDDGPDGQQLNAIDEQGDLL